LWLSGFLLSKYDEFRVMDDLQAGFVLISKKAKSLKGDDAKPTGLRFMTMAAGLLKNGE